MRRFVGGNAACIVSGWARGRQFGALQRDKRQQSLQIRQLYHRETKPASRAAFLAVWWCVESLTPNHYTVHSCLA